MPSDSFNENIKTPKPFNLGLLALKPEDSSDKEDKASFEILTCPPAMNMSWDLLFDHPLKDTDSDIYLAIWNLWTIHHQMGGKYLTFTQLDDIKAGIIAFSFPNPSQNFQIWVLIVVIPQWSFLQLERQSKRAYQLLREETGRLTVSSPKLLHNRLVQIQTRLQIFFEKIINESSRRASSLPSFHGTIFDIRYLLSLPVNLRPTISAIHSCFQTKKLTISIDDLCNQGELSSKKVRKDIQQLIKYGLLSEIGPGEYAVAMKGEFTFSF